MIDSSVTHGVNTEDLDTNNQFHKRNLSKIL